MWKQLLLEATYVSCIVKPYLCKFVHYTACLFSLQQLQSDYFTLLSAKAVEPVVILLLNGDSVISVCL